MTLSEPLPMHPDRVGKGWRRFFLVAGLFNILGGTVGLLDPAMPWTDHGLPAPSHDFAMRLLFATVLLFGFGYLMVWRRPLRHRGIVVLGLGTKILGGVFTWWAIADGQLPRETWWQPLIVDVPWAIGFAWFLWRFRQTELVPEP